MEYNIKLTVDYRKKFENEDKLDPKNFIGCNTIDELKDTIAKELGSNRIEYSSKLKEEIKIPDEFIREWKELVGFIPHNVMTHKLKCQLLDRDNNDIYTETYSGEYLNNKKHSYSWNTFNYHLYRDFIFDSKKDYKCYLIDHDHWDHVSTTLLFAEEI